jgi:DNA-binding MarR family transcriptional regulator
MTLFREIYGNSISMRIIEFLMEHQYTDFAVGDMARELKISRPKAYEIIDEYVKKQYINKTRIMGRTQLYKLNRDHPIIKIYLRNFRECIKMVIDEYSKKNNHSTTSRVSAIATKSI